MSPSRVSALSGSGEISVGLSWKTEYRFADYGTDRLALFFPANGAPTGDTVDSHKYTHTVRSEIVWRFNFGGPVVARY